MYSNIYEKFIIIIMDPLERMREKAREKKKTQGKHGVRPGKY